MITGAVISCLRFGDCVPLELSLDHNSAEYPGTWEMGQQLSSRIHSPNTASFKGKAEVRLLLLPGTTPLIRTGLRVQSQEAEELKATTSESVHEDLTWLWVMLGNEQNAWICMHIIPKPLPLPPPPPNPLFINSGFKWKKAAAWRGTEVWESKSQGQVWVQPPLLRA